MLTTYQTNVSLHRGRTSPEHVGGMHADRGGAGGGGGVSSPCRHHMRVEYRSTAGQGAASSICQMLLRAKINNK